MISNSLFLTENKINARDCIIKEVTPKEKTTFLNDNHIQGNSQSSINLGLYYKNDLVSLMTFGKKRMILKSFGNDNEFELLRFVNKKNNIVRGGASKLFKYFLKKYNPYTITSYSSCDYSNGNLYKILGFKEKGHSGIGYWWAKDKRYHRSNFMKHKLIKEGADPKKSESEIMRSKNYYKIWNSGNQKWLWEKSS